MAQSEDDTKHLLKRTPHHGPSVKGRAGQRLPHRGSRAGGDHGTRNERAEAARRTSSSEDCSVSPSSVSWTQVF